jgi:hypothetical protein
VDRPRRLGFISYAQDDSVLVERFLGDLRPRLANLRDFEVDGWWDRRILVGQRWEQETLGALETCDFGLLCVTPRFLTRPFITGVELPALLARRVVVPAVLEDVSHTRDELHGLGALQLFRYRPAGRLERKAFLDCGGPNRGRYCDALADELVDRLREEGR